jgi:hypothetical protein
VNCGNQPGCGKSVCCSAAQQSCSYDTDCCPGEPVYCNSGVCCAKEFDVCNSALDCCGTGTSATQSYCGDAGPMNYECLICTSIGTLPSVYACCSGTTDPNTHKCCSGVGQPCWPGSLDGGSSGSAINLQSTGCCELATLPMTCGASGTCCFLDGVANSNPSLCCSGRVDAGHCWGPC